MCVTQIVSQLLHGYIFCLISILKYTKIFTITLLSFNNVTSCNLSPRLLPHKLERKAENVRYVLCLTFLTVRKPLSRIIDKRSFVWCALRNEGNIAVLVCLVVYRCIADSLLCYVGN